MAQLTDQEIEQIKQKVILDYNQQCLKYPKLRDISLKQYLDANLDQVLKNVVNRRKWNIERSVYDTSL